MPTLSVQFKGQTHVVELPPTATVAELHTQVARVTDVAGDAQRLFQKRRRVDCSDVNVLVTRVLDCGDDAAPLLLVAGASQKEIDRMKSVQSAAQHEMEIRERRRVVDISKRNRGLQARDAVATSYRFHAIEPLPNFADKDKARGILEKLANDRGILAVMAKHKWSVGTLAEMPPDGKVGVDPVCVLGLNQNKGQKILLRLRTDDLLGFRKFLSIKKVLFHELSHNVHSEHDSKFYQLMRQVEKECNELDWTSSGGAAVGGSRVAFRDEEASERGSLSGHRLGGKSARTSRLLSITPPDSNASEVSTSDQTPSAEETQSTAPNKKVVTTTTNKDVEMENVEKTTTETVLSQHAEVSRSKPHSLTQRDETLEMTVDEEIATLGMSDRERRIHTAVQHLQRHYSKDAIGKAVSLLHKIVSNIIAHPADAKFRSIRKANRLFEGHVSRFPECLEFLLALGFEDQSDKFVLVREDAALLWIGRSTLEVLLPATA